MRLCCDDSAGESMSVVEEEAGVGMSDEGSTTAGVEGVSSGVEAIVRRESADEHAGPVDRVLNDLVRVDSERDMTGEGVRVSRADGVGRRGRGRKES